MNFLTMSFYFAVASLLKFNDIINILIFKIIHYQLNISKGLFELGFI